MQPQAARPALLKNILLTVLLLALAAVFLFSALSKLDALEPFTWTFMDLGIPSYKTASVVAHLFLGLELLTGLFLLGHVYLRQLTYPLTLGLLAALSVYLVYVLLTQGNTGDCGCFGNWFSMSPLWALVKNLGMAIAVLVLRRWHTSPSYKNQELVAMALGMASLVAPFLAEPLSNHSEPINLDPLYSNAASAPAVELRQGRHVVAFMSLTCPHCKEAAKTFASLYRADSTLPVFLVLNGLPEQEEPFFSETGARQVPHLLFRGRDEFRAMAGPYVPAIYYVENSTIRRKMSYPELSLVSLRRWK